MKQPKRLTIERPSDAYARAHRGLLRRVELDEAAFRSLERERPECIIDEGEAMLIGYPRQQRIVLHYAFPDRDAFVRQFATMLGRLLPHVSQSEAPFGFRLRLTDAPSRPYVEPVLLAQAFELNRDWMQMDLAALPDIGPLSDEVAPGFKLRPVRPDDVEAVSRIEDAAFPTSAMSLELALEAIRSAPVYQVLEETATGMAAGFILGEHRSPAVGYVGTIAVDPAYQRRGLGEALMRWALGCFKEQGRESASLTVSTDNGAAIALYLKLGFTPGERGVDYTRPIDEDEVRRVLGARGVPHIRVRKRY